MCDKEKERLRDILRKIIFEEAKGALLVILFLIRKGRKGDPLIIWVNPPGLDAELTPIRARELAEQLQMVASCAEEEENMKAAVIHCQGGNP